MENLEHLESMSRRLLVESRADVQHLLQQSRADIQHLLQQSLADFQHRLRALEEQVQAINLDDFVGRCRAESRRSSPTEPSALSRNPSGSTCEAQPESSTGAQQALDTGLPSSKRYTLGETVWEAPALVGRSGLPFSHSVNIVMAFALNVFVQALFCVIAWKTFAEEGLPVVEDIKRWRYTTAHDVLWADRLGVSLAGRVCGGDSSLVVSTARKELFDELSQYASTFDAYLFTTVISQGVLLCSVALLIWLLLVLDEWHALATFTAAMFFDVVNGVRMTVGWNRFLAMVVVAGIRLAISTWLFVTGVLWLLKTTSLTDIILNAAALHFVMDVDEIIFKTLMTKRVKQLLHNMEFQPPTARGGRRCVGRAVGARFACFSWLCVAALVAAVLPELQRNEDSMEVLVHYLCGGNVDFVSTHLALTDIIVLKDSDACTGVLASTYETRSLEEAVWTDSLENVELLWFAPSSS